MIQADSKYPFTEKEIEDIMGIEKYIDGTFLQNDPPIKFEDTVLVGPDKEDIGLVFTIRPERRTIGISLRYKNERIRGINNVPHARPDGRILRGWHEHIWRSLYRDKWAEGLIPRKEFSTSRGIVKFALDRWKIQTYGPMWQQLRLGGNYE